MWIKLWIQDRTSVLVRRQVNKLAYVLAQYVNDVANFVTWIEENLNMIEPHWLKMYWISLFLNESYIFLKKEEDKAVDTYFLLCSCNKKYHPCEYFMRGITWHVKHLQKIFLFVGLIQIEEGTEGVKKNCVLYSSLCIRTITITIIDIWTVNWLKCFPIVICGGHSILASTKDKVKYTAMTQEDDLLTRPW